MWGDPSEIEYGFGSIGPMPPEASEVPTDAGMSLPARLSNAGIADGIRGFGDWLRGVTEDARRAVAYTDTRLRTEIRNAPNSATDRQLSTIERAWLYSSDMEKVMLGLGIVGLVFVIYQGVRK